ncbi:MAG: hypothetical protein ABW223_00045 [Rariglobus sp.]
MPSIDAIVCEIIASRAAKAAALAEIAATCARDVGQKVIFKTLVVSPAKAPEPVLTVHLPVEFAASQHQVWCLACRLACFCPDARVSVLVRGESAFGAKPKTVASRRRRSA